MLLPECGRRPVSVTLLILGGAGCAHGQSGVSWMAKPRRFGAAVNTVQVPAYQAGMDARFAIAARHSRLVRILRVAVPAAVILAMTTIVFISIVNPFRILAPNLPLDMDNLVVSGTKITMESPHLSGFSPDQRPYELRAKTATQDVTDPDHVDLATLRAKVLMEDQTTVTMDARNGLFDTKSQMLDLRKDVFLQSSTGYEARLTSALVDIANGTVTSDEPVDVKLLNGTLRSDRLRIKNKGEVVLFEGNVVMNLIMDHPDPSAQPDPEAASPTQPTKPRSSSAHRASAK
jgi:lipopolysaccharide export system protein LptC